MLDDLQGSNGLAFSPDEQVLYVVESRHMPNRCIWAYDVDGGTLKNKRVYVDANGPGAYDGIAVDASGNVWCGFGSNGAAGADLDELDGVARLRPRGPAAGAHRAAGAVCQRVLRWREEQPALHGREPFAVRAVRQRARRGVSQA